MSDSYKLLLSIERHGEDRDGNPDCEEWEPAGEIASYSTADEAMHHHQQLVLGTSELNRLRERIAHHWALLNCIRVVIKFNRSPDRALGAIRDLESLLPRIESLMALDSAPVSEVAKVDVLPELLECCADLLEIVEAELADDPEPEDLVSWHRKIAAAKAAIAKAGGEA